MFLTLLFLFSWSLITALYRKSYHRCRRNELKKGSWKTGPLIKNTFQIFPWETFTAATWHRNKKIKTERLRNIEALVNRGPFLFLSSRNNQNSVIIKSPIRQEGELLQLHYLIAGIAWKTIEGVWHLTTKS